MSEGSKNMGKYTELSECIVEGIGGTENITKVAHCATRLRINYRNKHAIDMEKLKNLPGCAGTVEKEHQIQFIIGPSVNDAYHEFLEVSRWTEDMQAVPADPVEEDEGPRDVKYWLNKLGNFLAPIFMPIIPALVVGGMILALKNLLCNYLGFTTDGGTAQLMLSIFDAGFAFLPVYIGFAMAQQLKMQPVMGAMLGAVLITPRFSSGVITDFMGIAIPQVSYGSTVLPIILGVAFMYWVDRLLKKILPETIIYFMKPLLTMIIVVPVELIVLGPVGNLLSGYVGSFVLWFGQTLGIVAIPVLSAAYPYMVMLGLDKALTPIGIEMVATIGYNPITLVMGFVSNICIGASALALAQSSRDAGQKNLIRTFGITALFGVTEPAFYGGLIQRPTALVGTAAGAVCGGLFAALVGLRTFVHGGCPGLMTFLYFVDTEGSVHHVIMAAVTAVISITVSFFATRILLAREDKKLSRN